MPKTSEKDRVGADQSRINAGSELYKEWEQKWSPTMLENYYYGDQIQGETSEWAQRKYVINLFYPSINISKPSLLFQIPKYRVTPRLNRIDDKASDVAARAKLQEETINSIVQDPTIGFAVETGIGLLDAQFRFGVIQVGWTADYIDNPNADRPLLSDEVDAEGKPKPMTDAAGATINEPKFTLKSEGPYLKWIPAKTCRVSAKNGNRSVDLDWFAYYEWHHVDDVKQNPRYKNTRDLKATGKVKSGKDRALPEEDDNHAGMVKLWFLWDLRAKTRRIFAQGAEKYLLEEKFKFLPFAFLKFDEILGQWLPLPVSYNWVHPQNQLNDLREMRRQHNKRALPKYMRRAGAFATEEEFTKLMESEEGITVEVQGDPNTALAPVPLSSLDSGMFRNEADVLSDFTRESGISGESQQVAQSETATQANLIALMGQTRESAKRTVVGAWLSEIGRLLLLTIKENMALAMWIRKAVDPQSPLAVQEAQEVAKLWKQITNEELGDITNDVSVDIASMSPVQQAQERQDWIGFMTLLIAPGISSLLAASPYLLRKTASLYNINSELDLAMLSEAVSVMAMQQAQAMAQEAGVSLPMAPGPGPTPTNTDTMGQLQNQLPVEQSQGRIQ